MGLLKIRTARLGEWLQPFAGSGGRHGKHACKKTVTHIIWITARKIALMPRLSKY